MELELHLFFFPYPPTRCATLSEFVRCMMDLVAYIAIEAASLTFMVVDLAFLTLPAILLSDSRHGK